MKRHELAQTTKPRPIQESGLKSCQFLPEKEREKLILIWPWVQLLGGMELSGVELENVESSWICFCEMKWYSDISCNVSYDQHRNQLVRVIENALCFQNKDKFAEKIHVVLVTPKVFQQATAKSRLYQYKYSEYDSDPSRIEGDLDMCQLVENDRVDWNYPEIRDRIAKLSLGWISYEALFESMPVSGISDEVQRFFAENNESGKWVVTV
jgi:hypothetical protein